MAKDLEYRVDFSNVLEKETACDWHVATDVSSCLTGLSSLIENFSEKILDVEVAEILFFIATTLKEYSDKLSESEFYCYIKKEPTPSEKE